MKLTKGVDECTVEFADNGFVVRASGRNSEDDWTDIKLICGSLSDAYAVIKELSELPQE